MKPRLPRQTKETIDAAAHACLGHADAALLTRCAPVPVDEIIELKQKLRLHFVNLTERFGPRTLGAIDVKRQTILIDSSLDGTNAAHSEPRLRFTLAHELGHWVLHAPHLDDTETTFASERCSLRRIEREADRFASALLLPSRAVLALWADLVGEPLALDRSLPVRAALVRQALLAKPTGGQDPLEGVVRKIAATFTVSLAATCIRLRDLGAPTPRCLRPPRNLAAREHHVEVKGGLRPTTTGDMA